MKEISIDKLPDWYSNAMDRDLESWRKSIEKLFDKIEQTFELMESTAEKLEAEGDPEAASDKIHETAIKYANRLASSIRNTINAINLPGPETAKYSSLSEVNDELTTLMREIHKAGRRYIPNISKAKLYKREITELSYFLKDLTKKQKDIDEIVQDYEYIEIIEENFDKIAQMQELKERLSEINVMMSKVTALLNEIKKEKEETIKRKEELLKEKPFTAIKKIDRKLKKRRMQLRMALQVLDKPLKKYNKFIGDGSVSVSDEHKNAVRDYLEEPFIIFTLEETGYPILKSIVKKIYNLIEVGRLDVKEKLLSKTLRKLDKFGADSLLKLQKELQKESNEKDAIMRDSHDLFALQDRLNTKLQEIAKKESKIQLEHSKIIAEISWCEDRLTTIKKALEKNFRKELEEKVIISTDDIPLLKEE